MIGRWLLRLWFFGGFTFLLIVAMWAVVTIRRMQREQATAIDLLRLMAARRDLLTAVDELTQKSREHGRVVE